MGLSSKRHGEQDTVTFQTSPKEKGQSQHQFMNSRSKVLSAELSQLS